MGGLQLKSLELEQVIESISLIITYFNSSLLTANLMKYSLEYLQLEIEWDDSILLSNYSTLSHLGTDGWLKSIWRTLKYYYIELYLPSSYYPQLPIQNDRVIMRVVIGLRFFSKVHQILINLVRIKL